MSNTLSFYNPQIYVSCLAAYNGGQPHGAWIDATQDADAIYAEIKTMLSDSPSLHAEEWAVHDYDGFGDISNCNLTEHTPIEHIVEVAAFFEEHGDLGQSTLKDTGGDFEEAQELIENYYCGEFGSEEEHALHVAEEDMQVPDKMLMYIDRKKLARDLCCDHRFIPSISNRHLYVFHY